MRTIDDIVPSLAASHHAACFVRQEPLDAYLAETRYKSASMLRQAARAGDAAADFRIEPGQRLAEALHTLVLEPAQFARAYLTLTTDAPAVGADALDRSWLSRAEYAALTGAREAIRSYPRAPIAQYLDQGLKELSIYWTDEAERRWKARPDCFTRDLILELKTTGDVRPRAFAQTRRRFGYDLKAAHYIEAVRRLTGVTPRFAFVAVELAPPHYVWLYDLTAAELTRAQKELQSIQERLFPAAGRGATAGAARSLQAPALRIG